MDNLTTYRIRSTAYNSKRAKDRIMDERNAIDLDMSRVSILKKVVEQWDL
jgi:hypothetical protein